MNQPDNLKNITDDSSNKNEKACLGQGHAEIFYALLFNVDIDISASTMQTATVFLVF